MPHRKKHQGYSYNISLYAFHHLANLENLTNFEAVALFHSLRVIFCRHKSKIDSTLKQTRYFPSRSPLPHDSLITDKFMYTTTIYYKVIDWVAS